MFKAFFSLLEVHASNMSRSSMSAEEYYYIKLRCHIHNGNIGINFEVECFWVILMKVQIWEDLTTRNTYSRVDNFT